MFTGIVSKMGEFKTVNKKGVPELIVKVDLPGKIKNGDSIAVNGACLTVVGKTHKDITFNLSKETLKLSNLSDLNRGDYINIELPLTLNDFLSGHLVSGHLDGTVRTKSINKSHEGAKFSFTYTNREWKKFLIHKGSVTLNGVSLTISEKKESYFSVEIIPHTLQNTNLQYLKVGQRVNIELDLIGKYLYNHSGRKIK